MEKYIFLEKLVKNEDVVNILSQALLPDEDFLLAEVIETNENKDIFNVYAAKKGYCFEADLTLFAIVTRKNINGVNNYYVSLEGDWKPEIND